MNKIEEIRAWKAAYLAATPEEQVKMLAERNGVLRKREEERQKKIYEDRKARFLKKCDEQLAALETLVKLEKVTLEVIKKFDGKVLNARLTKAVSFEAKKIEKYSGAELKFEYNYESKMKVELYYFHGWSNNFVLKIFTNNEGRVDAEKTLEGYESNLKKMIADWKKVRKDYDRIFKKAERLRKEMEQYRSESNYIRDFFRTEYIIGYSNDL